MLNSTIETTAATSCKESEVSFTSHKQGSITVTYHIANLGALTLAETETERESENVWSDEYCCNVAVLGNLARAGSRSHPHSSGHEHLMAGPTRLALT